MLNSPALFTAVIAFYCLPFILLSYAFLDLSILLRDQWN